jgi:fumarate reductase flavoprotein subunit
MGLELGAKTVGMQYVYGHLLHREALTDDRLWPAPTLDGLFAGGILVDRWGRRFMDEGRGGIAAANVLVQGDDPLGAWVVLSERAWSELGGDATLRLPTPAPNPTLVDLGAEIVRAESARDLARVLSDEIVATVDDFDAAHREGRLERQAPARTGAARTLDAPLLALPVAPGITFTMGGLLVNGHAQVLDRDEQPIEGLYAAGGTAGGLHGGPRGGYIGGLGYALVSGLLAGTHIGTNGQRP